MSNGKEQPCGAGLGSLASAGAPGPKVGGSGEAAGPAKLTSVAERGHAVMWKL